MTQLWKPAPLPSPGPTSPQIRLFEVGPRDGLQAESALVPTSIKAELCDRLWRSGVRALEITSFVSPKWVPQLADAADLAAAVSVPDGTRAVALVPNLIGLDRARAAGFTEVSVVASATESFARANLNTTIEGSLKGALLVADEAAQHAIPTRGYLSVCFGDPWEGHVDPVVVADYAAQLYRGGCATIAISDTIGTATPQHIKNVVTATVSAGVPRESIALHLHDTYGVGLANVYSALDEGITEFDSAVGGLGRCPYAPGAAGNLATEDLAWMLEGLGVNTGLDLDALVETSSWMARYVSSTSPSRVVRARSARAD